MDPESWLLLVFLWCCPRPKAFENSAFSVCDIHRRPFKVHVIRNLLFCQGVDLVVTGGKARVWDWVSLLIN